MKLVIRTLNFFTLPKHDGDRGATVVEYALLVALIALVVIGAITLFGQSLSDFFGGLGDQLPSPTTIP
ncbi:MAG: Flp/Fap pilin component [Actinomycetota bacterium]|jgi:pilus assembly protein Flp/PilA